jgi:hypothetical protein
MINRLNLDSGEHNGIVGSRLSWDDGGLPEVRKDQPDFDDFVDDFVVEAGGYLIQVGCSPTNKSTLSTANHEWGSEIPT